VGAVRAGRRGAFRWAGQRAVGVLQEAHVGPAPGRSEAAAPLVKAGFRGDFTAGKIRGLRKTVAVGTAGSFRRL
jgi:hypothetical protein